jgi:hypothetical protein
MFFAATKVGAACDPNLPPGWCFENKGYQVSILPDSDGNFPVIDTNGNSVFAYHFKKIDPKVKDFVNWVDILIPSTCTPNLNPSSYVCYKDQTSPQSCYGNLFTGGSGDPLSGFGLGLTTENTWKWGWALSTKFKGLQEGTVSLTLPGRVYASKGNMFLKLSLLDFRYPFGDILAPSCGLVSAQVFPPQVPLATKKQEKISGAESSVEICIESTDQSGLPTSIYSCNAENTHACDCPEGDKDFWGKYPLSELQIVASTLQQVWIDPDPRSPATYIITSGSTCVKKCYPSGYCYVGPKGCTP